MVDSQHCKMVVSRNSQHCRIVVVSRDSQHHRERVVYTTLVEESGGFPISEASSSTRGNLAGPSTCSCIRDLHDYVLSQIILLFVARWMKCSRPALLCIYLGFILECNQLVAAYYILNATLHLGKPNIAT